MGGMFGNIGQISDMRYRGPEELPDYGQQPNVNVDNEDVNYPQFNQPGYQLPPMFSTGLPQQPMQPQPDSQQYFQQMRQNLDSLSEAFKQIEQMNMPGGQYQSGIGPSIMGRAGK